MRNNGRATKKQPPNGDCIDGDPCGTRTRVTAVKGRCLNLLTNGPFARPDDRPRSRTQRLIHLCPDRKMVAANGLEPSTLRV